MSRILRYEVPVDDDDHTLVLSGKVLHVACRRRDVVELWAVADDCPPEPRHFHVFGTGHPIPGQWVRYVGTGIVPGGDLVWHLMERV